MRFWKYIEEELSNNQECDENTFANNLKEEQESIEASSCDEQETSIEPSENLEESTQSDELSQESTEASSSDAQETSIEPSENLEESTQSDELSQDSTEASSSDEQDLSIEPSETLEESTQSDELSQESTEASSSDEQDLSIEPSENLEESTQNDEFSQESTEASSNDEEDSSIEPSENLEESTSSNEFSQDSTEASSSDEQETSIEPSENLEESTPSDEFRQASTEASSSDEQETNNDEENSTEIENELEREQKKELLKKLRDKLNEYAKEKANELTKGHIEKEEKEVRESIEKPYELSEQTNNFLNQLGILPSFENRERGAGYSIDTESYTDIPESIIRTLITKFLNQRFCIHNTDLNVRSNSLEKSKGFYKWEVKDVITHLQTHQVTKVLTDKYGYEYAQGKNEFVPLSFYFDMSGSMSEYTNMLAVIAIELIKKGVKVLIGFNERVNVQIDSIEKNITIPELVQFLENAGYWISRSRYDLEDGKKIKYKYIERNIDNYLKEKKAEKCVIFSDFDPISEVINLSQVTKVYWFCFENKYRINNLKGFNGFIYKVENIYDLERGLIKVNEKRFETLCYVENPENLQKKVRVRK